MKKITIRNEISCTKLQLPPEHLTRGLPPPDPLLSVLCPRLNLLNPLPNKIPGYATATYRQRFLNNVRWQTALTGARKPNKQLYQKCSATTRNF